VKAYHSLSVQWSRGCPFNCEFCDIIEVFGPIRAPSRRRNYAGSSTPCWPPAFAGACFFPTTTWWATKWRPCASWPSCESGWRSTTSVPVLSEASINLAVSDELIKAMCVRASTRCSWHRDPSTEALRETHKAQNLAVDLHEAVNKLARNGSRVAGFIVGFDSDDASAIERQREW